MANENLTEQDLNKEAPEITTAIPIPKKQYSPILKRKLTEAQEKKMVDLITQEMVKTLETYESYDNGRGWFNHVDRTTQDYVDGNDIDDLDSNDEKKRLLFTTKACDIVASLEKRQTQGPKPMILMVPKPNGRKYEANELTERQDILDYILRTDCAEEEKNYVSSRMACANGVAVEAYKYEKIVEYKTRKTLYNQQNIAEFEKNYASDIINPRSKAFRNWDRIKTGEEVEITDVEPIIQFNGVKPYRVDLKKFFARLDIKDFRRHKVISEMIDTYTWADIEARIAPSDDELGYFPEAVVRLKEKLGDKYLESKNTIYESEVFIKLDSEVAEGEEKSKDRYQRYIVTYEDEYKIILNCLYKPYEHNMPIYVAKCAIPRDDSWAGYSFSTRTKGGKTIAEGILNSMLHRFQLTEKGTILTDDDATDFSRVDLGNNDDISVIKFGAGKKFQQFDWAFPDNNNSVGIINWVANDIALTTGVDPAINSGAQTPDDPQAPYAKAALKQKNSDRRIEDIILNLQKGTELGAKMVDYDYIQFVDEEKKEYFEGDYICHGSTLSFSPEEDNQAIMAVWQATGTIAPQVAQNTLGVYTILNALYNNAGGSIKKNKDVLLKPLKDQLDLEEATKQLIQKFADIARSQGESGNVIQGIQKFVTWSLQQGRTEQEIGDVLPKVIEQIKAQPQGQPPAQSTVPVNSVPENSQPPRGMPPQGPPRQPGPPSEVIQ